MTNTFTDATLATGDSNALITKEDVKLRAGITAAADDTLIESLIDALPRVLQGRYGREFFGQTDATARTFEVKGYYVPLGAFDLRSVDEMVLHPEGSHVVLTPFQYLLRPVGADDLTQTYSAIQLDSALSLVSDSVLRFGVAQLEVTGDWGIWASHESVPLDVREACCDIVLSWMNAGVSAVQGVDTMDPTFRWPNQIQTWDIPMPAHRKLMPYNRNLGVY